MIYGENRIVLQGDLRNINVLFAHLAIMFSGTMPKDAF